MRLLVVHLSDIHIKAEDDPVLSRVQRISEAVESRRADADAVVIVVTGDIAFSGTADQYEIATRFLKSIAKDISGEPLIVVVPGNHDCDFTADSGSRKALINVLETSSVAVDESIVDQCVSVQSHFFAFRDSLDAGSLTSTHPLYYEYALDLGPTNIVVRCYNTAWVSSINEKPGTLVFPDSCLNTMSNANFAISAFHHPYNWLSPDKSFRRIGRGTVGPSADRA